MIRRLHVEGWRAFEQLTLEFDAGVTFVVAENGVGKTSLIDAARWGLYGDLSGIDAAGARRFGEAALRVTVDMEMPDQRLVRIERGLAGKKPTLRAAVDGQNLDEAELANLFAVQFGASLDFLSRTTLLSSSAVTDNSGGVFQLHKHLCHVFGVDDLQAAAAALERAHHAAEAEAKNFRLQARQSGEDISRLRADLARLDGEVTQAEAARTAARAALADAQERQRRAQAVASARQVEQSGRHALMQLWAAAVDHGAVIVTATEPAGNAATDPTVEDLLERLQTAETNSLARADSLRAGLAEAAARLETSKVAVHSLHDVTAECPVCRRELGPADIAVAESAHQATIGGLSAEIAELSTSLDHADTHTGRIRDLISQAARLRPLTADPSSATAHRASAIVDPDDAEREVALGTERDDELSERLAEVRAERRSVQRRIEAEQQARAQQQASLAAHRREAAASLAATIMSDAADAVLNERIQPLADEIMHRWKRVFVDRGELRLRHDGHLVLVRGTHEIDFAGLSSGEKVIALLATRLLVLAASTRSSFLWLDEPLEHLDPSNRRLVASLMASAGQNIRQLLVTTYEDALARRLASSSDVTVRYIRTAS